MRWAVILNVRGKLQQKHHNGVSLLEQLVIDLVSGIPLDPMHLTDLVVTRKLFLTWIRGKYRNVELSRGKQNQIAKRSEEVRSFITDDFPRKLGPLDLVDRLKRSCFRMIKLRLGSVLMRDLLPDNLYENFLEFHVAMSLLSNEHECVKPEILDYCSCL